MRLQWKVTYLHSLASLAGVVLLTAGGTAHGVDFPAKPARIVVPIGPGSSMDIIARVLGQKLHESWEQPVIVDNRAGAGGNIGADLVAKSAPDGYTVLFAASSLAISRSYYRKLPYDALRDFEPVTQISSRNNVLVVSPSLPVNSIRELIALAKAKPGQLSYGSGGGNGSSDHMVGELFKLLAGIDILHVPYKSGPQAQNDLIGGQIQIYLGGIPVQLPMIRAGKVKPLGTSGLKRSPSLPDVPTLDEAGVPGYEVDVWYGFFAPRGTPGNVVARISADVGRIVKSPAMHERLNALGVEPAGTTPAEFKLLFSREIEKWAQVVKAAGIGSP
ncbi:MAG: tripartite tricarboxylate transporter substrate binding protein [Betaproteobacteria bacterium]|nr:tripartite tricarboxylate transporter substrate binding protein [Betaproteobacteria bacterium]